MSSPVVGYPDFIRRTPMADQILINDHPLNPVAAKTYTVGYVPNIQALWMHFVVTGGRARVQLNWYADSGFLTLIGTSQLDTGAAGIINRSFRPFTPYLKVVVTPQAGGVSSWTLVLTTMADTNSPVLSIIYVNDLERLNFGIGASSVDVHQSQMCRVGTAQWMATCTAASWSAQLQVVDFNLNTTLVDYVDNLTGAGQMRLVYMGGGTPQITTTNNDAAAKTYTHILNWVPDISL